MSRWRNIVIRGLRSGILLGNQDTDSSDGEPINKPLQDDFCSDEESSCSESELEPGLGAPIATTSLLVPGSPRAAHSSVFRSSKDTAFRILGVSRSAPPKEKRICRKSLLQLVKAQNPSIDKAKHLLSGLTAADISKAIEQKDTKGNRVIHYACAKALVPWVELLIDNKADLNVEGEDGQGPIHFAVKGEAKNVSQVKDKVKVVKLLVKERVHADEKDGLDNTPLQLACDVKGQHKVIRALLSDKEIDVKQDVKSGTVTSSLFHITCQNDQFVNAQVLLKHGADPLAKDSLRGNTPFHIILRKGQVKFALRFLKICKENGHALREILLAQNAYQQSVLHEAVKCGDKELVSYCLKHVGRADLMKNISKDNSTLMHTVCKHGHHGIVQMLDEICPNLLTCPNVRRLTPLHAACSRKQPEVTKVVCDLLQHRRDKDIHIGMKESDSRGSPSLLMYAAEKGAIDCLVVLLQRQKQSTIFELLEWISVEKNLFKVLQKLLNKSEEFKVSKKQIQTKSLTRLCAEKGRTESLLELVAWDKDIINNAYGDGNSLLHLIARNGHHQTTKAILKNPDVQLKKENEKGQTALHVAIEEGHIMTSALILKTDKGLAEIKDKNKMTPLMYACRIGNIYIVKLLLEILKEAEVKIGLLDRDGLNCLDHAIDNGNEMTAVELLDQDNWRSLMTRVATSAVGGPKTTPMRKLIISMPGVCKFVLDKCIEPKVKAADIELGNVKIKVDFELLEDWYSEWMREDSNTGDNKTNTQRNGYKAVKGDLSTASLDNDKSEVPSNFNENGELKKDASIYVTDRLCRSKNHPLQHMIANDNSKELLEHPVVRVMFKYKHTVFRVQYWLRLFLQLTLLAFLTLHSLIIPPPYYVKKHLSGGNYTWLADGEVKWKEDLDPIALILFGSIGTWIILVLTVIYFIEFLHRRWLYWNTKCNWMHVLLSVARELTLLILIILFVIPGFGDLYFGHGVTVKADWQWELGAYAVLLAWINFMFFLKTASFFGIYILMFIEVISTMVYFLFVAGIFICTFAVVFCILIINQTQYHTFGDSLVKSLTMLTGGIDFDTVFHSMDYLYQPSAAEDFTSVVFYPHTTHVIFIIFLFTMPMVVMNLLTGLAVYDIAVIQKKANIIKHTIEAEGIMTMQHYIWEKYVLQYKTITVLNSKNVSPFHAIYNSIMCYTYTDNYLVEFLEKFKKAGRVNYTKTPDMKIDGMMDRIDEVRNRLYNLSEITLDAQLEATSGNDQLQKQIQDIHREANMSNEQLKKQMQAILEKLDKKTGLKT